MKIISNQINTVTPTGFGSYDNNVFLLIVFLHYNEKISREKMMGMFQSLKKGTLSTRKNTHYCSINKKWYNDETMLDILKDAMQDTKCTKLEIPLEEFIPYVNLYLNKCRNYCIDHIYHTFFKPLIERYRYDHERMANYLKEFGIHFSLAETRPDRMNDYGYCCVDCDGPWETFIGYRVQNNATENVKILEAAFQKYFNSQKKY